MTRKSALFLVTAAFGLPAQAFAQGQDFELPPGQTERPSVQGPVDTDAPVPVRPRVIATPTPTPRPTAAPAPTPTPAPSPSASPRFTPAMRNQPATVVSVPTREPTIRPPAPTPTIAPPADSTFAPAPTLTPQDTQPQPQPQTETPSAVEAVEEQDGGIWWLPFLLAALLIAGGGAWVFTRRRSRGGSGLVPSIEPPLRRDAAPAGMPLAEGPPLAIEAHAVKLTRSFMNVTLAYRLAVTNTSHATLEGVELGGDLVAAHGAKPVGEQYADPAIPLLPRHTIERLAPGRTVNLTGEIALPVTEAHAIRQGNAALLVPLLRWRAAAGEMVAVARTFVIGLRPSTPGGRLQPFRLDVPPASYDRIAQRALD